MRGQNQIVTPRKRLSYAVSVALASLVAGNSALAQTAPAQPPAPGADDAVQTVMVVGARASQQSAIDRKKNAATATDSIVAEDVGAFPDRNVGEAISRIAGIALNRGDFGEGVNVSVRGNGPDLTRVEIDGMGVQAGGGTDLNGGGSGRGVELREMSSDLIKSVDVVKGSTPDMTEGSLGGGIIIKTRTGLDFKKRYLSARVAGSQSSLNKEWAPDLNFVYADKFMGDRLGIIVNLNKSAAINESHSSQVNTSGNAGYGRLLDFDNSPEKTFTFNPALVDPNATAPMLQSPLTAGGFFNSSSPLDVVRKSGAAATKADCYAAFPTLSAAQLAPINGNVPKQTATNQRSNELLTCLNQWNDYTPSNVRYVVKRQEDKRNSGDVRLDFKVNSKLSVYAKLNRSNRTVQDNFLTHTLGGLIVNNGAVQLPDGTVRPTYTDVNGVRTATPGSGYSTFPNNASYLATFAPLSGAVANVIPGSVTVDSTHHVTKMGLTDNTVSTDQIHNIIKTHANYMQAGGNYRDGGFRAEFLIGKADSDFQRGDMRTSWSYNYGPVNMSVLNNGMWGYDFPAGSSYEQANAAKYAVARPASVAIKAVDATVNNPAAPAYTINQQPLLTQSPSVQWTPLMGESQEKTAKLDLSYAFSDKVPFFSNVKSGFNLRENGGSNWGNTGYTVASAVGEFGKPGYVAPIVVPHARVRGNFIGCTDTPGSLGAGGAPCKYGYAPRTNLSDTQSGTTTLTQAQYQDVLAKSMEQGPWSTFFNGAKDRPASLTNGWNMIDVPKTFDLLGVTQNMNYDCVKECMANDGKIYPSLFTNYKEKIYAGYLMTDFELTKLPFTDMVLPWGMELTGNFGYRYVRTEVEGNGMMTFTSIQKTAAFDPFNPNIASGTTSTTFIRPTTLSKNTTDIMPILNLALWAVPDTVVVRYNRAKSIARQGVFSLLPSGNCTYDARKLDFQSASGDPLDQNCTGTIGNPGLQPRTNLNQNLSLEWYANKDTMFTVAKFHQKGIIGPAVRVNRSDNALFAGTDLADSGSGAKLSDVDFSYATYENGPTTTRTGTEFGTKTAFTFLPWFLRNTGLDLNYTKVSSTESSITIRDLLTGETLAPAGEPEYSYNASLWYDDGAFSARIAVQAVAQVFNCIAACGANTANNFPAPGAGSRIDVLSFNPGSPNFKERTSYIDAKVAYKFENGIELFAEARNLGKSETVQSQGQFVRFADGTQSINERSYAGRRILVGVNIRH